MKKYLRPCRFTVGSFFCVPKIWDHLSFWLREGSITIFVCFLGDTGGKNGWVCSGRFFSWYVKMYRVVLPSSTRGRWWSCGSGMRFWDIQYNFFHFP